MSCWRQSSRRMLSVRYLQALCSPLWEQSDSANLSTSFLDISLLVSARGRRSSILCSADRGIPGCIGGVGFFLFVTGIEVSARLDGNLEYTLDTGRQLIRADTVLLWTIPLALAVLLLIIKHFKQSPYIVPAFFISIAAIFYIVVTATKSLNLANMRRQGWVFAAVKAGVPWYHFYSYYGKAVELPSSLLSG